MTYALPVNALIPRVNVAYENFIAVTPADNTPFPGGPMMGFVVGVGGTVTFCPRNSTTVVQITAVAGTIYPFAIQGINATGTAATGIVAFG